LLNEFQRAGHSTWECGRWLPVHPDECDLFIQWGYKPTEALLSVIKMRKPFVIMDMGYFDGHRHVQQSVSINGFHGLSMEPEFLPDLSPRRSWELDDWKLDGDTIYIMGQLETDVSLRGQDIDAWMGQAAAQANELFPSKKIIKRPHPRMLNPWEKHTLPPLETVFDDAFLCMTWTSTVAVSCLKHGIPVVAQHPASPVSSLVTPVCRQQTPEGRDRLFHKLDHATYRIRDGCEADLACAYILRAYDQARAEAECGMIDTIGLQRHTGALKYGG
jgi:hypothetical protein